MRGKKVLVLDQKIVELMRLFAEVGMIREHGVDKIVILGPELQTDIPNVIYLVRPK